MIYTSNYKSFGDNPYGVSISGDRGKEANYKGAAYPSLAPKLDWWKKWELIKDRIDPIESTMFYIEKYYDTVLSELDPEQVYKELDGRILLCYEEPQFFCHRHIVAAWLEIKLNIEVPEVMILADGTKVKMDRPSYVKEMLLQIMELRQGKVLSKTSEKPTTN